MANCLKVSYSSPPSGKVPNLSGAVINISSKETNLSVPNKTRPSPFRHLTPFLHYQHLSTAPASYCMCMSPPLKCRLTLNKAIQIPNAYKQSKHTLRKHIIKNARVRQRVQGKQHEQLGGTNSFFRMNGKCIFSMWNCMDLKVFLVIITLLWLHFSVNFLK